ncbi:MULTISPECIES: pyruvate, water dikinase regulatory protein [unclassified Jeotgalibaca]|uniref:pyruvate, water dikinase regulatory protein n=1 Tax=unclassified Jeotgalibaca TaxID=2621505 RepID=UPI003FCEFB5C
MNQESIHFFIISDSVGETARKVLQAVLSQFPTVNAVLHPYPFIRNAEDLQEILLEAKAKEGIIIHTLVVDDLSNQTAEFCDKENLRCHDILRSLVDDISIQTKEKPTKRAGALHRLDDEYFNRISAIEFAVKYDDGKDAKGLLEADLVLLGISRTSKTPLSMFLANKNVKVANLPILPEASIPEELWEVNPKKIVGLTNNIETLTNFRRERMLAYGLPAETVYTNSARIQEEIDFAMDLYQKLGCSVINVAHRSIEETAEIILQNILAD